MDLLRASSSALLCKFNRAAAECRGETRFSYVILNSPAISGRERRVAWYGGFFGPRARRNVRYRGIMSAVKPGPSTHQKQAVADKAEPPGSDCYAESQLIVSKASRVRGGSCVNKV
ncbi:hypothetical protein GTR04_4907 [Trichophyton interdigitale]|uniref:Uncharacterized protein n=1 Tax=Trichophyton interdigitale TaxID=101480 RepID=A0A9P5D120_9EURO|nr:hypothetical protein GY632_1088 [Trichophyton interdigitale]KAG5203902.1 hypothetical protein GY631_7372 [Trichophyton interdigitale]KAG8207726.1 hypothetical protein GTR04_4907 [Trichophyton interdigitale]